MTLRGAIDNYKNNLNILRNTHPTLTDYIINVLISRDYVQDCLKNEPFSVNCIIVKEIENADKSLERELKNHHKFIAQNYKELVNCRKIMLASHEAWWWDFKKSTHILDVLDPVFNLLTLFCLGFSFSISIEMISRILEGEGDLFLSIVAAIQASLTLWIGKTFLTKSPGETFSKVLNSIFDRANINQHLSAELSFAIAFFIAGFTFLFRLWIIPLISIHHNNKGVDNRKTNISQAFLSYQRAININPDNIEAKYYLGELYDELSIPQKAKELYEEAILEGYIAAYNNLGRLLIKEKKYSQAYQILIKGYELAPEKLKDEPRYRKKTYQEDRYASLKNLGWVRFMEGNNREAIDYLNQAIKQGQELESKKVAANCLLAEVLEVELKNNSNPDTSTKLKQIEKIIDEWKFCQRNANPTRPEENFWSNKAKERIKELTIMMNELRT